MIHTTQKTVYRYDILNAYLIRNAESISASALQIQGTIGIPLAILATAPIPQTRPDSPNDPIDMFYAVETNPITDKEREIMMGIRQHYAAYTHYPAILANEKEQKIWKGLCAFIAFIANVIMFGKNLTAELSKNIFYLYPKTGLRMICKSRLIEDLDEDASDRVRKALFFPETLTSLYVHDPLHNALAVNTLNTFYPTDLDELLIRHHAFRVTIQLESLFLGLIKECERVVIGKFGENFFSDLRRDHLQKEFFTDPQYTALNPTIRVICLNVFEKVGHRISYFSTGEPHPIVKFEVRQPPTSFSRAQLRHITKTLASAFINSSALLQTTPSFVESPKKRKATHGGFLKKMNFIQMKTHMSKGLNPAQTAYMNTVFDASKNAFEHKVLEVTHALDRTDRALSDLTTRQLTRTPDTINPWEVLKTMEKDLPPPIYQSLANALEDFYAYLFDVWKSIQHQL